MSMKGRQLFPLTLVLLVLAAPCPAQSTRVALIDTSAFDDLNNGIRRLANAVHLVDREFRQRQLKLSKMLELMRRHPGGAGFVGPIPTDPKPMTRERRKKLKEEAEEMWRAFELERKEYQSAYNKRLEEVTTPISKDILMSLEAFAKARGITMLIDASNLNCPIGCQVESAADINITREFIAEYNRLHP
jgi:hypothetical protein